MAAPAQAGDAVVDGFGSFAWSGYVGEDGLNWTTGYNAEEVTKDQNGATLSKIRMDQYEELSGSVIIDDGTSEVIHFAPGAVVSITTPDGQSESWEVQSSTTVMSAGAMKLNITLRKEVSMTYSA